MNVNLPGTLVVTVDGVHVPAIPFLEVVGKTTGALFRQSGPG